MLSLFARTVETCTIETVGGNRVRVDYATH
jgi:hypothetical protein